MAVPKPPCGGCIKEGTSMFSSPCVECSPTDNYRHFVWGVPARTASDRPEQDAISGQAAPESPEGQDTA